MKHFLMIAVMIVTIQAISAQTTVVPQQNATPNYSTEEYRAKLDMLNSRLMELELQRNKLCWEAYLANKQLRNKAVKYSESPIINEDAICDTVEVLRVMRQSYQKSLDELKAIKFKYPEYKKLYRDWTASYAYPKDSPERRKAEADMKVFNQQLMDDKQSGYAEALTNRRAIESLFTIAVCRYTLEQYSKQRKILSTTGISDCFNYFYNSNCTQEVEVLNLEINSLKQIRQELISQYQRSQFGITNDNTIITTRTEIFDSYN